MKFKPLLIDLENQVSEIVVFHHYIMEWEQGFLRAAVFDGLVRAK